MTNLIETPVYEAGIFQLETTTPVIGGQPAIVSGAPVAGHSNAQALQLANRTAYLKGKVDGLSSGSTGVSPDCSIPFQDNITAAATSPIVEAAYSVTLGGADSNSLYQVSTDITGTSTAGTPVTGYTNATDLTPNYTFLSNASGHNEGTADNSGRTGIYAHRTKLLQAGSGDLAAYNASVRITGTAKAGATHWLANPAGIIINGTVIGESNGCYLNPFEFYLTDKPDVTAYNTTCVGVVINQNRNHVSDTQANGGVGQVWAAFRSQSTGSQYVDSILSGTGKFFGGVDLSMPALDFGTNKAAILMKAYDRVYFNASADQQNDGTVFIRANWRATTGFNDYSYYDTVALRWKVVIGGVETLQVSNAQVTVPRLSATDDILLAAGKALFVGGSKVVGTRVVGFTAFTGTTNTATAYATSTITLQQLAERVAGMQIAMTSHGLIGA